MEYSRVDPKKLFAVVNRVIGHLTQADEALAELADLLTSPARSHLGKPKAGFEEAARTIAHDTGLDAVKKAADYDGAAVLEDLDNVVVLKKLAPLLSRIQQRIDDADLLWTAEAYGMNLVLYGLACVYAKTDAAVAQAIEPLVKYFATPRLVKPKT